jgi:hypothetical protein
LERYFNPVKALQTEVSEMKTAMQSFVSKNQSAAQLYGRGTGLTYNSGTRVTDWYTASGARYSPILRGGMTYSNGYITVPMDGVYYVYVQMYIDPLSGQTWCGFYIHVNDSYAIQYVLVYLQPSTSTNRDDVRYAGALKTLNKGDRLSVVSIYTCYFEMYPYRSHFGAFLLV